MFYFFSCPVTDQQPKNVLPISVATRNFLFINICDRIKKITPNHQKRIFTCQLIDDNQNRTD
jgi:hypothetical protein